jgi:hypothetical protein
MTPKQKKRKKFRGTPPQQTHILHAGAALAFPFLTDVLPDPQS